MESLVTHQTHHSSQLAAADTRKKQAADQRAECDSVRLAENPTTTLAKR